MAKRHRSPCIDVCQFSGPKGWCLGCGRTRKESQGWDAMKPYDRKALVKQLPKRMSRIEQVRTRRSPES